MNLSSFQFHLIMGLVSAVFYLHFRGIGVALIIATAFLLQTLVVAEKQRNWKRLKPLFHALWLTQLFVVSILYMLCPNDFIESASRLVSGLALISSPLDRVAEAASLSPEAIPAAYKHTLQVEFFQFFYPAALLASVVGSPLFSVALARMMQLAETARPSATRELRIIGGLMLFGFLSLAWALVFLFDFAILPGRPRGLGPIRPVVVSAVFWVAPFFMAFALLLWKQAYNK